jgi:hypothetical protein
MNVEHPTATLSLLGRASEAEEEFAIELSIGVPYPRANGSWACPVELSGLHERLPDMVGNDSLQALCLAIRLSGRLLTAFVERGGRLRERGDEPDDTFSLDHYFGT